jgi:regulatory protein
METPPTITSFEVLGKRGARIRVFLAGQPWAELDAETVVRERLGRGQPVDAARERAILATDELVRARKAAAGNMARKPKTRRELERYLHEKKFSAPAIEAALEQLTRSGTVDDQRVAERHVRQRRRKGDTGPRRLVAELRARGLDEATIRQQTATALEGVDLQTECNALAAKAAPKYAPLADPKQRQKLANYLLRRGYDGELVRAALAQLAPAAEESDEL